MAKAKIILSCFLSIFFQKAISQSLPNSITEAKKEDSELSMVIVYRSSQFFGAINNWALFDRETRFCKLSNSRYTIYQREPGSAKIGTQIAGFQLWPKKVMEYELELEAGEVYFFQGDVKSSFTRFRVELTQVSEEVAQTALTMLTQDRCDLGNE